MITSGYWVQSDDTVFFSMIFSQKEIWTLGCSMDFMHMPFDEQACLLRLALWTEDYNTSRQTSPSARHTGARRRPLLRGRVARHRRRG